MAKAKSSVKTAKKSKQAKKLSGFYSIHNTKFTLLVALVVGFAAGGSYWTYSQSASAQTKDLTTVQGCEQLMINVPSAYLRQGSTGSCVRVVQIILNEAKIRYGTRWAYLNVDGNYGPITASAVSAYQQQLRNWGYNVSVDGLAGRRTFNFLKNLACPDIAGHGTRLHSCGY